MLAICFANLWPRGQAVKTSPFHGGNTGSIPVGVTKKTESFVQSFFTFNLQYFALYVKMQETEEKG